MSLPAINALHTSRLDPKLRHLALVLATYAQNDGGNIRPGIRRIARDMGLQKRAVYYGIQALVAREILIRTGWYRHLRCYRLDYTRLAAYQFTPKPGRLRAHNGTFVGRAAPSDRCHPLHLSEGGEQRVTGAVHGQREVQYVVRPILISDLNVDLNKNRQQCAPVVDDSPVLEPGADAPVVPQPEPAERREEREDEEPEPEEAPVFQLPDPPFAAYTSLAREALNLAALERDDSVGNVAEHLKRLCAQDHLPYEAEIIRKAVDAALVIRQKRADAAWASMRSAIRTLPPAPVSHPRRARELAKTG